MSLLPAAEESALRDQVDRAGWAMSPECADGALLASVAQELEALPDAKLRGGVRNLFEHSPATVELARSSAVRRAAEAVLGADCFAVKATLFDKTPDANWKVTWHQDVTIVVRYQCETPGFAAWTTKAGWPHVQPPTPVLERMLAVRVHLDDCSAQNGPLRVIAGSHRHGRLTPAQIDAFKASAPAIDCVAQRGELLVFRPLLLHASSPAQSPDRRRVVHLEFAADELPNGLQWLAEVR